MLSEERIRNEKKNEIIERQIMNNRINCILMFLGMK
jgi:hypothetical protein